MKTVRLQIQGQVQGVWFRESMRREAENHGVTGWVSNRADGSVEAVIQGAAGAVDHLLEWAKTGPPMARVERVLMEAYPSDRRFSQFEKRTD